MFCFGIHDAESVVRDDYPNSVCLIRADGFLLTIWQRYNGWSDEFYPAAELTEEYKYEYHRSNKSTRLHDVSCIGEGDEEFGEWESITFIFDEAGRVIKDHRGQFRNDLEGIE